MPCHVCLYRISLRIFSFMIVTILYLLTSCFTTCVLFHQSPALILSYREYPLLDIICCISTCSCMLVPTTRFSMHDYDSDLSIHVCLSMHAIWHSHHHSLGSSVSPEFSCLGLGAWSLWMLPITDQSSAAVYGSSADHPEPYPSRPPCSTLEFSCCNSWAPFVLFILVDPCILTFAPYWWYNILEILYHFLW